jgi:OOP family OmpA-OmpF porin
VRNPMLLIAMVMLGCSCSRPPGPVGPQPGGGDAGTVEDVAASEPADVAEPEAAPEPADAGTPLSDVPLPEDVVGTDENPVRIFFEENKSDVQEIAYSMLDAVIERLRLRSDEVVRLVAHCDEQERPGRAMELATERAEALVQYFAEHGVKRERFIIDARADFEPAGDNETPEGRATNRRVDFVFQRGAVQ